MVGMIIIINENSNNFPLRTHVSMAHKYSCLCTLFSLFPYAPSLLSVPPGKSRPADNVWFLLFRKAWSSRHESLTLRHSCVEIRATLLSWFVCLSPSYQKHVHASVIA
jgi:hypothetical protein